MSFYSLSKEARARVVEQVNRDFLRGIQKNKPSLLLNYFSDADTYIRKAAYTAVGKVYASNDLLSTRVIVSLTKLLKDNNPKVRQTTINAAGEIGRKDFEVVESFFDTGLFDEDPSVRNAVIGSIKKMGEKNPKPVLKLGQKVSAPSRQGSAQGNLPRH